MSKSTNHHRLSSQIIRSARDPRSKERGRVIALREAKIARSTGDQLRHQSAHAKPSKNIARSPKVISLKVMLRSSLAKKRPLNQAKEGMRQMVSCRAKM